MNGEIRAMACAALRAGGACAAAFVLVAALVVCAPTTGYADVVGSPPESCPRGSTGNSNHGGPFCAVAACAGGCGSGMICASTGLCIEQREGYSRSGAFTYEHVAGNCSASGACQAGTCQTRNVCLSERPAAGCSTCGRLAPWLAAAMLPALLRRRNS